ncbi:hypothetical protein [Streptomyces violascens]|uniref:DUF3592 domain-containing protein n=1 Tax=Streptomyces violascens TaxID=67381 RepID=A0ABQ3QRR1_9ACTN|nr:hypothetical protein [Streptomyces violascens]GHI39963.1 hypothetical protein Sviol_43710 [Streptomyces violascens]
MTSLDLSQATDMGRWWIFIGGAAWVACAAGLAAADLAAYRRRVTTPARCIHVENEPGGIVRHTLERLPVANEKKLATLRTKSQAVRPGGVLKISYDPKHAHEVFLADRHPRIARLRGEILIAAIGCAQILYILIRWGLS